MFNFYYVFYGFYMQDALDFLSSRTTCGPYNSPLICDSFASSYDEFKDFLFYLDLPF